VTGCHISRTHWRTAKRNRRASRRIAHAWPTSRPELSAVKPPSGAPAIAARRVNAAQRGFRYACVQRQRSVRTGGKQADLKMHAMSLNKNDPTLQFEVLRSSTSCSYLSDGDAGPFCAEDHLPSLKALAVRRQRGQQLLRRAQQAKGKSRIRIKCRTRAARL